MEKSALVILHQGFEEMEAIAPIDILRRGGIQVTTASCNTTLDVLGRSNVCIKADVLLEDILENTYDGLIIPGGSVDLMHNKSLLTLVREHYASNRWIGAICAAPLVLQEAGILQEHRFTAHACVHDLLKGRPLNQRVVVDHPLITSQGPGTATAFAFALLTALVSPQIAREVAMSIHWYPRQDWQAKSLPPEEITLFENIR